MGSVATLPPGDYLGVPDRRHVLARDPGGPFGLHGSLPQGSGQRLRMLAPDAWELASRGSSDDEGTDGLHHDRALTAAGSTHEVAQ